MKRIKVIYAMGNPIFSYKKKDDIGYKSYENLSKVLNNKPYFSEMDLLLEYLRYTTKTDILLAFEYLLLKLIDDEFFARHEIDANIIQFYNIDSLNNTSSLNTPKPTYISEYINVLGQLFLAGYIDFGSYCDEDRNKIDYPSNLSYYKEDKYQAWIYFRDNFFYKERFERNLNDDVIIDGCSTMFSPTSWDTPQYWSQYNIWVAITPKGTKYFKEILAPKFYNKYKDLEVEIDDKGNIIRWIGEINR
ncbi:hypothetical protein CSUB8523_1043 [Campylobacter subantarcticus LMG 24377]|uniref:hypothetical protein n=2 Tax=Campylobacter subantarcticus TaxID=497724 RepID=UPI0005821F45|nr:hypothetical protein [Campylobacter subantarcticus]AJC92554.1 hypothetical protein CSUB8523_1043 [Campylobacter subantarcticus LMG 24377]